MKTDRIIKLALFDIMAEAAAIDSCLDQIKKIPSNTSIGDVRADGHISQIKIHTGRIYEWLQAIEDLHGD